ncbi:MAG: tripartite tricarboxylate transporter substrate binding protein [Burkholderiales bacterium]|jgi:tripartite-type tricarboxylate transporter receptor subunit TctC|uniref:Bug family tripartite tricarboxylate transporter substrate binding protein n=1 Tax=Orrella sp. TaxID=1921583 RepID=UPI002768B08C|nr:tripartite tricarboxylate transporter substrate binding protein [Burkholderiales bacterium]
MRQQTSIIRYFVAVVGLSAALIGGLASAQSYPNKPIRLVVPFAPGGAADAIARTLGEYMQNALGQPVIIDNRPGAGTTIGVGSVAKASPDGYTLLLSGDAAAINEASGRKLSYDLRKDLSPVAIVYTGTQFLLVKNDSQFVGVKELVAFGRANPGEIKFGSSGQGTSTHLSAEIILSAAGVKALHVPYKGVAPALNDLMGGIVDFVVVGSSAALPAIKGNRLRPLAVTGTQRISTAPDAPTLIEQGVNVETKSWYGLFAPAQTPKDVLAKLSETVLTAVNDPDLALRFTNLGGSVAKTTPAEATRHVSSEVEKYKAVLAERGINLQ